MMYGKFCFFVFGSLGVVVISPFANNSLSHIPYTYSIFNCEGPSVV